MKRVLVVYFSNGGGVEAMLRRLTEQLAGDPRVALTWMRLTPTPPYPFPWSLYGLFDTAPETIAGTPLALASQTVAGEAPFDLVILGWQVWWLRPSAPICAFVQGPGRALLRDSRVVLAGCSRQMWLEAEARLRRAVEAVGGRCSDSLMVRYQGAGLTLVTTPLMLLTGRRAWPGWLPQALPRSDEMDAAARCGRRLLECAELWRDAIAAPLLAGVAPGSFDAAYRAPEQVASLYMALWRPVFARFARRGQWSRGPLVCLWAAGFAVGVLTVVPGWRLIRGCIGMARRISTRLAGAGRLRKAASEGS